MKITGHVSRVTVNSFFYIATPCQANKIITPHSPGLLTRQLPLSDAVTVLSRHDPASCKRQKMDMNVDIMGG